MGRIRRAGLALTMIAAITACAVPGLRRAAPSDAATAAAANAASWASTLLVAHREVDRGRHAEADRTLSEFAERAPASPEAVETLYWRALIMLDPTSRTGSAREAATMLEKYLASDAPLTHRAEAGMLQRVASSIVASAAAKPAMSEAEIKALKDELEQAKAELERIRKRLVAPPPTTPPPGNSSTDAE
jgi:hypothetical protein